jgi:hypothetical protein
LAFRAGHTAIAFAELAALGYLWTCALTRRRDNVLRASMTVLAIEGVGLVVGRGNCPLGPLQRRLGDSVPLFELVLPPRAAKAAVPVLAAVSVAGMALVMARPPSTASSFTVVKYLRARSKDGRQHGRLRRVAEPRVRDVRRRAR